MDHFGRFIGIDVGTKRVGLARTDLLRTSANTVGTYSPEESIRQIGYILSEGHTILGFVVGWPLTLDGEESGATKMVERYTEKLKKAFPGIDIHLIDERYSSRVAVDQMIAAGVPREKRQQQGRVDQAAAALLLQQFIETNPEY